MAGGQIRKEGRSEGDRRIRQADRLARVLRLLGLIQGPRAHRIHELAGLMECSERTVYRDLAVLQYAGVPYYVDRESSTYRVRPGFRFPQLHLTDDEVLGLAVSTALSRAPNLDVTPGALPTTTKLSASSDRRIADLLEEAGRLTSVLDLKLADHRRHHEAIRTVQWSLIRRRRLHGQYRSPHTRAVERLDLHPYRLCLVKQAWYLIARPEGRSGPHTYRVTRFRSLRPSDAPAIVPEDFDLATYFGNAWSVYRGDRTYSVRIRFQPHAADLVNETVWHPTQKAQHHRDGGVTLSFQVDGLEEIVHWVLGWSAVARVVEPAELRDLLLARLREAVALNTSDTP